MYIDYDHQQNGHSVDGPGAAFPGLFPDGMPATVLDVGCGIGTWLRVALNCGASDVFGIDGVDVPSEKLLIPRELFKHCDLTQPVDLGRKFDAVLCLEVAEHLDEAFADVLIETLVRHSDRIIFSAACPDQRGQHHVNCQWPEYWQRLFNLKGFACEDSLRWRLWSMKDVEPWYRQNVIFARKDPRLAGNERRIPAVIHPDNLFLMETNRPAEINAGNRLRDEIVRQIQQGHMPAVWYVSAWISGYSAKLRRRFFKRDQA